MITQLQKRLTLDEMEAVAELVTSEGWKPFLKLVEELVIDQEQAVLRLAVGDGIDKLVHAKLRAEGARKLSIDLEAVKKLVKGNHSAPPKV